MIFPVSSLVSRVSVVVAPALLSILAVLPAAAQTADTADTLVKLKMKPADRNAVEGALNHVAHIRPPSIGAGNRPSTFRIAAQPQPSEDIPSVPNPGFYPGDVSNPKNGPVVTVAESNPIYVNAQPAQWGRPATFLKNLSTSGFIHVVDQYVGVTDDNRYTVGAQGSLSYPAYTALDDNDILQIAHAAAQALGTGYGHIYHIFLPKGVDVCFTGTSICYSPDTPSTFAFCAYHASVDFNDIGHVLYTVEPFQNVNGCRVAQPSPNPPLVDSTANSLSHELFETISDPDGNAWWDRGALVLYGEEIGDTCANPFFDYPSIPVGSGQYAVQSEYSNTYHACSYVP